MKRRIILAFAAAMFMSAVVWGGAKTNKSHKGKTGADGAKISCVYCHKTAGIPKKKLENPPSTAKGPFCSTGDCHQKK